MTSTPVSVVTATKFSHDQAIEESGWLGIVIALGQASADSSFSRIKKDSKEL
jgi:hypothetical protein